MGQKFSVQIHIYSGSSDVKMEKWNKPKLEFSLKQACNLTIWLLCWGNVNFFFYFRECFQVAHVKWCFAKTALATRLGLFVHPKQTSCELWKRNTEQCALSSPRHECKSKILT